MANISSQHVAKAREPSSVDAPGAGAGGCPLCLEPYNGSDQAAKLLPCRHIFCLSCLTRWIRKRQRSHQPLTCPVCRYRFTVPEGGAGNFRNALKPEPEDEGALVCVLHDREPCLRFCMSCKQGLCVHCMRRLLVGKHKGHKIRDIDIAFSGAKDLVKKTNASVNQILEVKVQKSSELQDVIDSTRKLIEENVAKKAREAVSEIEKWKEDSDRRIEEVFAKVADDLGGTQSEFAERRAELLGLMEQAETAAEGRRTDTWDLVRRIKAKSKKLEYWTLPESLVQPETSTPRNQGGKMVPKKTNSSLTFEIGDDDGVELPPTRHLVEDPDISAALLLQSRTAPDRLPLQLARACALAPTSPSGGWCGGPGGLIAGELLAADCRVGVPARAIYVTGNAGNRKVVYVSGGSYQDVARAAGRVCAALGHCTDVVVLADSAERTVALYAQPLFQKPPLLLRVPYAVTSLTHTCPGYTLLTDTDGQQIHVLDAALRPTLDVGVKDLGLDAGSRITQVWRANSECSNNVYVCVAARDGQPVVTAYFCRVTDTTAAD